MQAIRSLGFCFEIPLGYPHEKKVDEWRIVAYEGMRFRESKIPPPLRRVEPANQLRHLQNWRTIIGNSTTIPASTVPQPRPEQEGDNEEAAR